MPAITPNQKVERVKHFGGAFIEIELVGDDYDAANLASQSYCEEHQAVFVHPFDDPFTIAGQGTIAKEVFEELSGDLDVVIAPIGGGGLAAGLAGYLK
jgi:threonine dehydratase